MRRVLRLLALIAVAGPLIAEDSATTADSATASERGPAAPLSPTLRMTNDAAYDLALAHALDADPGPAANAQQQFTWLTMVVTSADLDRHYDLEVAAATAITRRWPHLPAGWISLSNGLGNLGRFASALAAARTAESLPFTDAVHVAVLAAVWTWQLGHHDQALAMLAGNPPKPGTRNETTWLLGQACFHAACDHDDDACKQAIHDLFDHVSGDAWRRTLGRSVAFDRLREKSWFVDLVGTTATAASGAEVPPFHEPALPSPGLARIAVPVPANEVQARADFAVARKRLAAGDWAGAVAAAKRSLKSCDLPEARLALAMAEGALDHPDAVEEAMVTLSLHGFNWRAPGDISALIETSNATQEAIARAGNGGEAQALQMLIYAHLLRTWKMDEQVVYYMNQAQIQGPDLAAVLTFRALANLRLGRTDTVQDDLDQALRLQPGRAATYFDIASWDRDEEHFQDALTQLTLAGDNGGDAVEAACDRARIFADLGRCDDAVATLAAAVGTAQPTRDVLDADIEVAEIASRTRHDAIAERQLRAVIAADPTYLATWDYLAIALLRAGRLPEALAAAERVHEQWYDDPMSVTVAATVLAHLDRKAEAAALMATLPPPKPDQMGLFSRTFRALYAAAIGDAAMLQEDLTALRDGPHHHRYLRWLAQEPLLDAYRAQDWYQALSSTAAASADATAPAPAQPSGESLK
jgi:tetratricopeptide (TPR) repeat protein